MDILPSGNIFRELQDIQDFGYFSSQSSIEDQWQQASALLTYYPAARELFRFNPFPLFPQTNYHLLRAEVITFIFVSASIFNLTYTQLQFATETRWLPYKPLGQWIHYRSIPLTLVLVFHENFLFTRKRFRIDNEISRRPSPNFIGFRIRFQAQRCLPFLFTLSALSARWLLAEWESFYYNHSSVCIERNSYTLMHSFYVPDEAMNHIIVEGFIWHWHSSDLNNSLLFSRCLVLQEPVIQFRASLLQSRSGSECRKDIYGA